jgi:hypothetical protein
MNTKKIAIIALALIALIGGVLVIARSISNRDLFSGSGQNPMATKKEPANLFGQGSANNDKAKEMTEVTGELKMIGEKTITVKSSEVDSAVVNINGATPVMLSNNENKTTLGQMADLQIGDTVRVTYDKTTKNVNMIFVIKSQTATKK